MAHRNMKKIRPYLWSYLYRLTLRQRDYAIIISFSLVFFPAVSTLILLLIVVLERVGCEIIGAGGWGSVCGG